MPVMPLRLLALLLALALAGCATIEVPNEADGDLTGPLTALPPCDPPPSAIAEAPGPGVVLPPGARMVQQREQGPLLNALAYVPLTPIQIRLDYEAREGIEFLHNEDEVFEAELLFTDGVHRTFVRATAICDRGSNMMVVVAPATDPEGLPVPGGDGTTSQ
jgi:hypothetical protein